MKKHISVSSIFLIICLVGAVITAVTLWRDVKGLKSENDHLRNSQAETANLIVDKYIDRVDSVPHVVFQDRIVTRNQLNAGQVAINKGLLDTMVMALKVADGDRDKFIKRIAELTRVKATLEGRVQGIKGDPKKGIIWDFASKYLSATVDTTFNLNYKYNAEVRIAATNEPSGFLGLGTPKRYIDISSPDPNFTINSVDRFRVEVPNKPKPWGIGIIGGWTIDPLVTEGELRFRPSIGVGVSFNLIRF